MPMLLKRPVRRQVQKPKLERTRNLPISKEAVANIKQYKQDLESLDRVLLKQNVEQYKIDSCMLLFHTTDKKDVRNDRVMCTDVWAFSFKAKPINYSRNKFKYTWITLGNLDHSFLDSQVVKDCNYCKNTNITTGYGDVDFYTRWDSSKSVGFTKANPIKELKTKFMYFCFLSDSRRVKLETLVYFGLQVLEEFNAVYEANNQLFHLYINPIIIFNFLERFEKAEWLLQNRLWNSVKKKHIGKSCSILGFGNKFN